MDQDTVCDWIGQLPDDRRKLVEHLVQALLDDAIPAPKTCGDPPDRPSDDSGDRHEKPD